MLQYTKQQILLILRYQHITAQIKQYLTHKRDMSQTYNCKDDHIKMTTITTIGFTSAMQLAYAVIIQSSDRQGTLTHQPYKPL